MKQNVGVMARIAQSTKSLKTLAARVSPVLLRSALSIAGVLLLWQMQCFAQTAAHGVKQSDEWLQRPLLHVEQLPAGFYYVFRDGDTMPTYCIKVPSAEEKQHGEIPYIENRAHARAIDSQYGLKSEDPHLSYEQPAGAQSQASGKADAAANSPTPLRSRKDSAKGTSPFKRNMYWGAIKSLPKSAGHALFGPNPSDPKPLPVESESGCISPELPNASSDRSDNSAAPPKP